MSSVQLVDVTGRRRSPATLPEFRAGRPPQNKGRSYPADPPTVDEIVAVMAPRPTGPPRQPAQRPDRCAVASRAANP